MGALEPWHLVLVLVIVLLLFGPGKLPQVGKAIGDSLHDFKKASSGEQSPPAATQTTPQPQAHICPKCQVVMPAGARFCGACGGGVATL
jgi:sec-independent protein translocase protein TatA